MESLFQLQLKSNCMQLSTAVIKYVFQIISQFLLLWTDMMDSSMTASMVAFATSIDSIPLPEFVSLDAKYVCVNCHLVLNVPRQLPCGHRICKLCVDKLFEGAVGRLTIHCPSGDVECDSDITADQVMQSLYDMLIVSELFLYYKLIVRVVPYTAIFRFFWVT